MLGWNAELLVLHPFLDDHSGRFRFGCHSRSFFACLRVWAKVLNSGLCAGSKVIKTAEPAEPERSCVKANGNRMREGDPSALSNRCPRQRKLSAV